MIEMIFIMGATKMTGYIGIAAFIIALVLTIKIGKVIFANSFGTFRAWAGAYVVLFAITFNIVIFIMGKVFGVGSDNSRNNMNEDYSHNDQYTQENLEANDYEYNEYYDEYDENYTDYYTDNSSEYTAEYEDESWNDMSEYILPYSDYEYVEQEQLKRLSKEELRIARNEIFARHGRIFHDNALRAYFESKSWYYPELEPDEFDSQMQNILNEVEKENVEMIKREEAKR